VVETPIIAYIGLGSNLGDRRAFLRQALDQLAATEHTRVAAVATVEETEPVGPIQQPKFLNTVARIETTLAPLDLLDRLLTIEQALGRVRKERWGPRTIDLDILTYGTEPYQHPRLTIPHPEIANRPFIQKAIHEIESQKPQ
jgi:2-amino-4-hydroxy-6-hydroxymethyldihydropteridine diphosphokinase